MMVLNHEPRFLSITPDTGQLELEAKETHSAVRNFMLNESKKQGKSDTEYVAVPLVTAVWFHESHVPSPPIHTHEDGTMVTNFPESLALWAGVNDTDRTAVIDSKCEVEECPQEQYTQAQEAEQRYWDGIRNSVRAAEQKRPTKREMKKHGPPFKCKKTVRFGVSNDTARINYPFSVQQVTASLQNIGYAVDYEGGEMNPIESNADKSEL
jgi:hypothetical protein